MTDPGSPLKKRFCKAKGRLNSPSREDLQQNRVLRLREDIDAFRRDLDYLESGGTIILAPDSAEIQSFIEPEQLLGLYCFPLEDAATFDLAFAKSRKRQEAYIQANATRKIARRVLRAAAHLFHPPHQNILLPPCLRELDVNLSRIRAMDQNNRQSDLDEVFELIEQSVLQLDSNDEILKKLDAFDDLSQTEQERVIEDMFSRVANNPVVYADDLNSEAKDRRISKMLRARDFVLNSKSRGVKDFDWTRILGPKQDALVEALRDAEPDKTVVDYLESLFFELPRGSRTNLSIYTDALALAYVAALNERLQAHKIKIQFVSWALSPVTVARAFWPETEEPRPASFAEVRHPKLLAAAINFSDPEKRNQVIADLDRFSGALSLYGIVDDKDAPISDDSLDQVREAWEKLDNTFLAWATRIEAEAPDSELPLAKQRLEQIRNLVSKHRDAFQIHLVARIDKLSKELSDAHWTLTQPENVEDIKADCLLYEPNRHIIVRPQMDHARFAIALYDPSIVAQIWADFQGKKAFGTTLAAIARTYENAEFGIQPQFRAEIQLLKAFLFAVRRDFVFAAQYCRLARAELSKVDGIWETRAEILYLDHYAHRELGKEKQSKGDEFASCLRFLDRSKLAWEKSDKRVEAFGSRYPNSWLTTCREIAMTDRSDFSVSRASKEKIQEAYRSCLNQLTVDLAQVSPKFATLERYQKARTAQNLLFAFIFDACDVGGWRRLFVDVFEVKEQEARLAWKVMSELRRPDGAFPKNMTRNEIAFAAANIMFEPDRRDHGLMRLHELEQDLNNDPALQSAVGQIIRKLRQH